MTKKSENIQYPTDAEIYIDCTGDVVKGDIIKFTEGVFVGNYRNSVYTGDRTITAEVTNDSYGADKQQHTFSLLIIRSEGEDPLQPGQKTRRKGRNVYRNGTERAKWKDESQRREAADEKHGRGDAARAVRRNRNNFY